MRKLAFAVLVILIYTGICFGDIAFDPAFRKSERIYNQAAMGIAQTALPELRDVLKDDRFEYHIYGTENLAESIRKLNKRIGRKKPESYYKKLADEETGATTVGYMKDHKVVICVYILADMYADQRWPEVYVIMTHEMVHAIRFHRELAQIFSGKKAPTDNEAAELEAFTKTAKSLRKLLKDKQLMSAIKRQQGEEQFEYFLYRMDVLITWQEESAEELRQKIRSERPTK